MTSRTHREINPSTIGPPAANYAHAIRTEGAIVWLHTAGVVPIAPDGSTPDDVGGQARVVWSNISAMLDEAGLEPADVVSVTTYAVVGQPLDPIMAARDEFLAGHRAASTLVTVPALADARWKVEIAVIAAR